MLQKFYVQFHEINCSEQRFFVVLTNIQMDDPASYKNSKALRDDNHAELIDEFTLKFNWRQDGRDSVLDIGSAGMCGINITSL